MRRIKVKDIQVGDYLCYKRDLTDIFKVIQYYRIDDGCLKIRVKYVNKKHFDTKDNEALLIPLGEPDFYKLSRNDVILEGI